MMNFGSFLRGKKQLIKCGRCQVYNSLFSAFCHLHIFGGTGKIVFYVADHVIGFFIIHLLRLSMENFSGQVSNIPGKTVSPSE